uniref:ZAD domain-containing protein n=1 Tax=Culex tarsalis TaxID=7177 RepID=A0A1Q3EVI8_CULTA
MQSRSTSAASIEDDFRCRLCLRMAGPELRPLFPPGEDQIVLLSRIFDCLAIHVSFLHDFNAMLCSGCREKIESFYLFRKQCQSNDEYIRRKRSNLVVGPEFERKDSLLAAVVKEPEVDTLLADFKDVFMNLKEKQEQPEDVKMPELAPSLAEQDIIEIPSSSGQSNESFCGFSLDNCARRSPRIFIQQSITEATERQQTTSSPPPEIHAGASQPELPKLTKIKTNLGRPRGALSKKAAIPPSVVKKHRRKAVLYYQGNQFARPKKCPTGGSQWSCSKTNCPVKLNDDKLLLSAGPHQHEPHVIRQGTIMNLKRRRRVPFLLAKTGHSESLVYDNAFRFKFSRQLPSGQQLWACEAAQTDECGAHLKIMGDFKAVACVFKHSHPEVKMILDERPPDLEEKA